MIRMFRVTKWHLPRAAYELLRKKDSWPFFARYGMIPPESLAYK